MTYDPIQFVEDTIDDESPQMLANQSPAWLLGRLLEQGSITVAERDAGEVFAGVAEASLNDKVRAARLQSVRWKSSEGKWSVRLLNRLQATWIVGEALSKVSTENRRRVIRLSLGSRAPSLDWSSIPTLVAGLEDLSRRWIGGVTPVPTTVNRFGVTMPKILGDNDATLERLGMVENEDDLSVVAGARRIRSWPLERMYNRGQLDGNSSINESLWAAALRYKQDYNLAGMSGIATFDPAKPQVDGGRSPGGTIPERRLEAMQSYGLASKSLGAFRSTTQAMIIDEHTVSLVSVIGSGPAKAAVKVKLVAGLSVLSRFYDTL